MLVEIPYLLAYSQASRGFVFTGTFWSPHDLCCYLAAMYEAASGTSWLVHNHLSSEPHDPAFIYTLYVALGKLAGWIGIDFQVTYHLAEVAGRAALLLSIYGLCSTALEERRQARLAFLLATFSTGVGFWLGLAGLIDKPIEVDNPGFNTFLSLFIAPHQILGLGLLLLALRFYSVAWRTPTVSGIALVGAVTVGLGLANPFGLVTLCVPVLVHLLAAYALWRRVPAGALTAALVVGLCSLPFFVHSYLVFGRDPFWSVAYGARNVLPSPPLLTTVAGYGGVLAMAIIGAGVFLRQLTPNRLLVLVYLAVTFPLMYSPVEYQVRFTFGSHPIMSTVAAVGLTALWSGLVHPSPVPLRARRFAALTLLIWTLFIANAFLYLGLTLKTVEAAAVEDTRLFQPRPIVDASLWLASLTRDDDVVLAAPSTSNLFARWARGRVYAGHPIATLDFESKAGKALDFLSGQGPLEQRRAFLTANDITYVFCGPAERALGADWLLEAPFVRLIYDRNDVRIFAIDLNWAERE